MLRIHELRGFPPETAFKKSAIFSQNPEATFFAFALCFTVRSCARELPQRGQAVWNLLAEKWDKWKRLGSHEAKSCMPSRCSHAPPVSGSAAAKRRCGEPRCNLQVKRRTNSLIRQRRTSGLKYWFSPLRLTSLSLKCVTIIPRAILQQRPLALACPWTDPLLTASRLFLLVPPAIDGLPLPTVRG